MPLLTPEEHQQKMAAMKGEHADDPVIGMDLDLSVKDVQYRKMAFLRIEGKTTQEVNIVMGMNPDDRRPYQSDAFKKQLRIAMAIVEAEAGQYHTEVIAQTLMIARNDDEKTANRLKALGMLGEWAGLAAKAKGQAPAATAGKTLDELFKGVVESRAATVEEPED